MIDPTKMPFGLCTWVGPRNYVLGGGPGPPEEGAIFGVVLSTGNAL